MFRQKNTQNETRESVMKLTLVQLMRVVRTREGLHYINEPKMFLSNGNEKFLGGGSFQG